jgi:hypothetical protein
LRSIIYFVPGIPANSASAASMCGAMQHHLLGEAVNNTSRGYAAAEGG